MKILSRIFTLGLFIFALPATAGHLFTQAILNTPIQLNAGQGIVITQESFESSTGNAGRLDLYFLTETDAWDTGDTLRIAFAGYTQDFSFNTPLAGSSQSDSDLSVTSDPVLAALNLDLTAPVDLTVQAVRGDFTFSGYRIYTGNETLDGTGSGLINQSQVVVIGNNSTSWAYVNAGSQTVTGALDSIQVRLDGLRNNQYLAHNSTEGSGMSSGDAMHNKNYWLRVFGGGTDQDMEDGFAGYQSETYGLSFGADTQLSNQWTVGGAFTNALTEVDMNDFLNNDNTDIDTYQLTAYAYRSMERWYIEAMAAYAHQEYSADREAGAATAKADFDGDIRALRVTAGMPLTFAERYTVAPYTGLELLYVNQDSYTEKGAGASSLNVSSVSETFVRGLVGAELSTQVQFENGTKMVPSLRIGLRHEFSEESIDATTAVIGGGPSVTTQGQAPNENTFTLDAAVDIRSNDNLTIRVNLGGEKSSGYYGYSGQLVAEWSI